MIIREIVNRRSVRDYQSRPVSKKDIFEVIKAGQFAPNGMHTRAWEFIVIQDQESKDKIDQIVGQEFIREAPVLIIPAIDTEKSVAPIQDLSVATENMFLQAEALGLGTVWKNIDEAKAEEIKKLLNIPQKFMVINIIPLGYPQEKPEPHSNLDFEPNKIHWGGW